MDLSIYRLYLPAECGTDGYPLAWHETIKHDVREQAGHRCIRCQHPYRCGQDGGGEWSQCDDQCVHSGPIQHRGDLVFAQWRILTVHHLDKNKPNCRWWNLAALCQRCHLSIQSRVKLSRRWLFEHSEWFKPCVAGYYAFALLGEDLSRDEVTARLDELLSIGRSIPLEPTHIEIEV